MRSETPSVELMNSVRTRSLPSLLTVVILPQHKVNRSLVYIPTSRLNQKRKVRYIRYMYTKSLGTGGDEDLKHEVMQLQVHCKRNRSNSTIFFETQMNLRILAHLAWNIR